MKALSKMITIAGLAAAFASCSSDNAAQNGEFKYLIDEFADLKIMRYQVPGWDALSLQQKEYAPSLRLNMFHIFFHTEQNRRIIH